ncbi:hypothetical protein [Congregicoccus parvus]
MFRTIAKRPWLLVVLAFLVLSAAWATLIVVAERNRPEAIPIPMRSK